MKTNVKFLTSTLIATMLLMSMAIAPAMGAVQKTSRDQQMPEEVKQWLEETTVDEETKLWRQAQTEKWMQNHTVNITSTKIYKYENEQLQIKEIYTGENLANKVGINQFTKVSEIPIDTKERKSIVLNEESFDLKEGNERVIVTQETVVITSQTDPFTWWNYGYAYPQWTWSEDNGYYGREDPINLAWESTDKSAVKSRILDQDWIDNPYEYDQYVSDPEDDWILDDGVADDRYRINGGYHARLWEMSNGDVVANVHHDSSFPHVADEYEPAEDLVAGFFDNDLSNWWVLYDNRDLDNYVASPLNDEDATCIYKVGS